MKIFLVFHPAFSIMSSLLYFSCFSVLLSQPSSDWYKTMSWFHQQSPWTFSFKRYNNIWFDSFLVQGSKVLPAQGWSIGRLTDKWILLSLSSRQFFKPENLTQNVALTRITGTLGTNGSGSLPVCASPPSLFHLSLTWTHNTHSQHPSFIPILFPSSLFLSTAQDSLLFCFLIISRFS